MIGLFFLTPDLLALFMTDLAQGSLAWPCTGAGVVCAQGALDGCPAGHTLAPDHGETGSRGILEADRAFTLCQGMGMVPSAAVSPKEGSG